MDLTKLSLTELKALAYDCLAQIELHQNNLRVINEQITGRGVEEEKPEKETQKK